MNSCTNASKNRPTSTTPTLATPLRNQESRGGGLGRLTHEKMGSVHLEGINASLGESDSGDETPLIKIPSGVPRAGLTSRRLFMSSACVSVARATSAVSTHRQGTKKWRGRALFLRPNRVTEKRRV